MVTKKKLFYDHETDYERFLVYLDGYIQDDVVYADSGVGFVEKWIQIGADRWKLVLIIGEVDIKEMK